MPVPLSPTLGSCNGLRAIPYEEIAAGKPPIPITVAPPPPASPEPSSKGSSMARSNISGEARRDSGLAPSSSTAMESRTTLATDAESALSSKDAPSLGSVVAGETSKPSSQKRIRKWRGLRARQPYSHIENFRVNVPSFTGIKTTIPTGSIEDLTSPGNVQFSKRGSLLIGGKRANSDNATASHRARTSMALRQPITVTLAPTTATNPARVISVDDDLLSQRVRSFYINGTDQIASDSHLGSGNSAIEEEGSSAGLPSRTPSRSDNTRLTVAIGLTQDRASSLTTFDSRTESLIKRQGHELAGGIEDWEDVQGGEVDRYGFIVPRSLSSPSSSSNFVGSASPEPPRMQRVSTTLQLASEVPRRQRSKLGRKSSVNGSTRSATAPLPQRIFSKRERRPPSSQGSYQSSYSRRGSRVQTVANRFPHSRDRRWVYNAGDMLTLPPGLADITEHEEDGRMARQIRRREREREDKWTKMARQIKTSSDGGGMVFDFDTRSPKLISRTWKGIPDRWRATAWHAFLTASALKQPGSPSDDKLKSTFIELLDQSSPDDVQIDIDVPRTINSHIMFRRRYRGGQRLLFRVLHCLSIYFPETGYVQGMAALAATILCYFDEEMAFVMLVRMWQLRGLARLYESGFEGLLDALDEFDKQWLAGSDVATKMNEFGIPPTAYGTRWYLTIFNYSIPFAAQLRVWDVFMLLGDAKTSSSVVDPKNLEATRHDGGLDVLHATSAALIDGTREILLESDFENAMKVLTSWIPIRDEEILMRVVKAEWKMHRRKR